MLNIVIFGAPGSGKGTQSELIIKRYGLHHISTGDLLREEIANRTPLGLIAEEYMLQGSLVPDQLVIDMLANTINSYSNAKGFLFDGFPRTLVQGEELDELLREKNTSVATALYLSVDEDALIQRLIRRGELYGRDDDNLEIIKERLNVYKIQTEPLKEYYRKQGKLFKIQGNGTIEEVFDNIVEVIELLLQNT